MFQEQKVVNDLHKERVFDAGPAKKLRLVRNFVVNWRKKLRLLVSLIANNSRPLHDYPIVICLCPVIAPIGVLVSLFFP